MSHALKFLSAGGRQLDGPLLFIMVARNRLERKLIEECFERLSSVIPAGAAVDRYLLPNSREGRALDLSEFVRKLEAPPETLLVPIRVAWLMPDSNEPTHKPLALRHLVFGDPRLPGNLRGR